MISVEDVNNGIVDHYELEKAYDDVINDRNHPFLPRKYDQYEIKYITEMYRLKDYTFDKNCYYKIISTLEPYTTDELNIARKFTEPEMLADHFMTFIPNKNSLIFERAGAIKALKWTTPGTWLVRHSSYDIIQDSDYQKIKNAKKYKFYAISIKYTDKISHLLILKCPCRGWAMLTDVKLKDNDLDLYYMYPDKKYEPTFMDILLKLSIQGVFTLSHNVSKYV